MLQRLIPRSDRFFDDFEAQCAATLEGARRLAELFGDFTDIRAKVEQIKEVEHRGDQSTHVAFERLHKQFITPFADRRRAVQWGVAGRIVWAWIFTIPASATIAAIVYGVTRMLTPA